MRHFSVWLLRSAPVSTHVMHFLLSGASSIALIINGSTANKHSCEVDVRLDQKCICHLLIHIIKCRLQYLHYFFDNIDKRKKIINKTLRKYLASTYALSQAYSSVNYRLLAHRVLLQQPQESVVASNKDNPKSSKAIVTVFNQGQFFLGWPTEA